MEGKNETFAFRKMARLAGIIGASVAIIALLVGCSSGGSASNSSQTSSASTSKASLSGSQLNIYCGAGMTDPFQKIAGAFESKTGCKMNITFANAAQIQTQIDTTKEGDFFIAGSAEELKPVENYVETSTNLVKHIPVLAVPSSNPKSIASLADLEKCDLLLIGDPESTPIGKIAKKALTDAGIWETLQSRNAVTTTTTAPQIANALAKGEGDAGIVWKENVKADGASILNIPEMSTYVKTVPAARLTSVADKTAADEFEKFLQTEEARKIWEEYGYEVV